MYDQLRHEADKAAQGALRDVVAYMFRHGGKPNPLLDDTYRAAERVVDAVDELEQAAQAAAQGADDGAPDFHAIYAEGDLSESEKRFAWGDR